MEKELDLFELVKKYRSALMGASALFVLFFHTWIKFMGNMGVLGLIETYVKRFTFFGVDIFFFISGMGLVFSINKENTKTYYIHRLKRIFIPYVFTLLIYTYFRHWNALTFAKIISCYAFYFEWIYSFLWFVPAILTFYLLFPLYYHFMNKSSNKGLFIINSIIFWLLISLLVEQYLREDLYGFTNRIPVFILGVYFGWLSYTKTKFTINWEVIITAVLTLLLGLYFAHLTNFRGYFLVVPSSNCCIPNILITISLIVLIPVILEKLRVLNFLSKILSFYGMFSFELYCLQEFLYGQYIDKLLASFSPFVTNCIFLVIVTILSYSLYYVNKKVTSLIKL